MKRINSAVFIFLCIFLCAFNALAIPRPTDDIYVNDFANVLSEETKNNIIARSGALDKDTSAQLVVVTIQSLEGESIDNYALNILRDWGIGDKEKNNGVLLLLSIEDRQVKIEVGYGLEGAINDAKAGRILDEYGIPYFQANDWNNGTDKVYIMLLNEIYKEYGMEAPQGIYYENVQYPEKDIYINIAVAVIIIFLIIIFFSKGSGGDPFIGGPFIGTGLEGDFGNGGFRSSGGGFGGGSAGGGGASRGF